MDLALTVSPKALPLPARFSIVEPGNRCSHLSRPVRSDADLFDYNWSRAAIQYMARFTNGLGYWICSADSPHARFRDRPPALASRACPCIGLAFRHPFLEQEVGRLPSSYLGSTRGRQGCSKRLKYGSRRIRFCLWPCGFSPNSCTSLDFFGGGLLSSARHPRRVGLSRAAGQSCCVSRHLLALLCVPAAPTGLHIDRTTGWEFCRRSVGQHYSWARGNVRWYVLVC